MWPVFLLVKLNIKNKKACQRFWRGFPVEVRAHERRVKVVIADDHPVILFGAEQALLKFLGIQVVARAEAVHGTYQRILQNRCVRRVVTRPRHAGRLATATAPAA